MTASAILFPSTNVSDEPTRLVAGFDKYIHVTDAAPFLMALAVVVSQRIKGISLQLLLVGPPGCGKTACLKALELVPGGYEFGMASASGLISATPKKDRDKESTGGLLRMVGENGFLLSKDFTTVLSMDPKDQKKLLAALREVADGKWVRNPGSDGGKQYEWKGKCGFCGAVTPIIDEERQTMSTLGDRFLFVRYPYGEYYAESMAAMEQEDEADVFTPIQVAVVEFLDQLTYTTPKLDRMTLNRLHGVASLLAKARSHVQRGWNREADGIAVPEVPTRLSQQLAQVYKAATVMGMDERNIWRLVSRVVIDTIPAYRRMCLQAIAERNNVPATIADIKGKWSRTVEVTLRRSLEDLVIHGLLERMGDGPPNPCKWKMRDWVWDEWWKTMREVM
jgi:hypothetical protein